METSELLEMYKSLFETWRFEVNSHWQRSSYFAAFETVAIGACWTVLNRPPGSEWASVVLSVLGILLTAVWYLSNGKTHFYAVYWLRKVALIEERLIQHGEPGIDFANQILNRSRGWMRHRHLVQAVPLIFLLAWIFLLVFGVRKWLTLWNGYSTPTEAGIMRHVLSYESVSLVVAIASLLVSIAAVWVARNSLSQAKQVADRDRRDWKQRKWFDLYFKADEAYDCLDRFRTLYPTTEDPAWGTKGWERDWNDLVGTMRVVHRMAAVFPKNAAIDELLAVTAVFQNPEEAVSKDRLSRILNAVQGVREKALVDAGVLT